jgi:hypothetical protein
MARTDSKIEDFAEELGTLLGNAQAKAEGWLSQRTQIAKSLEGIRDTASKLLSDLGHQAQRVARRGRLAGRKIPLKREPTATVPKRRKMSAAARARISAAQKARWAKVRAAQNKK